MQILRILKEKAEAEDRKFLLIGGHALNAHGISRNTSDLDLMVSQKDISFWKELLANLRYTIFRETQAFIQSKPPDIAAWPIDLMIVDAQTMEKALSGAVRRSEIGVDLPIASVGHLIAMKLHALRSNQPHRMQKDIGDTMALLEIAKIVPSSDEFRQLCLKYGNIELYERLNSLSKT